jgi:hypothetical protein
LHDFNPSEQGEETGTNVRQSAVTSASVPVSSASPRCFNSVTVLREQPHILAKSACDTREISTPRDAPVHAYYPAKIVTPF